MICELLWALMIRCFMNLKTELIDHETLNYITYLCLTRNLERWTNRAYYYIKQFTLMKPWNPSVKSNIRMFGVMFAAICSNIESLVHREKKIGWQKNRSDLVWIVHNDCYSRALPTFLFRFSSTYNFTNFLMHLDLVRWIWNFSFKTSNSHVTQKTRLIKLVIQVSWQIKTKNMGMF